jgi:hypothetical protein
MLLQWFRVNWGVVAPWLPHIELLDKDERAIDGMRERSDMGIPTQ